MCEQEAYIYIFFQVTDKMLHRKVSHFYVKETPSLHDLQFLEKLQNKLNIIPNITLMPIL